MADEIKIVITRQRFEEVFSIYDSFHLADLTNAELCDYMMKFVINENGEYLSEPEAIALFKKVPRVKFGDAKNKFYVALRDALVNPTSGG